MYFLVFHGPERFRDKPFPPPDRTTTTRARRSPRATAHDAHATHAEPDPHADDAHGHAPHESPWVVTLPLILLAIPSVVIGAMTIGPMLFGDSSRTRSPSSPSATRRWRSSRRSSTAPVAMAVHALDRRRSSGSRSPASSPPGASTCVRPGIPAAIQRRFALRLPAARQQVLHRLVQRARARRAPRACVGTGLWRGGDVGVIDGILDRRLGAHGRRLRRARAATLQSGYLYWYALVMIVGVIGLHDLAAAGRSSAP